VTGVPAQMRHVIYYVANSCVSSTECCTAHEGWRELDYRFINKIKLIKVMLKCFASIAYCVFHFPIHTWTVRSSYTLKLIVLDR